MSEAAAYRLGLLLVTLSAIAWSTAGFFTRLIPLDTATQLFWRGLFGGIGILAFLAIRERGNMAAQFRGLGWPGAAFAIVSALGMLAFIASLNQTSVAHVAIIYATVPFIAAGLGWIALRERPSANAIVASLVALAGVVFMVGSGAGGGLLGDFLALAMTLAVALMMVIARKYRDAPMMAVAGLSAFVSALAAAPFMPLEMPQPHDLVNLALFGLVNSALGLALFAIGSRLLPPVETALIGALDAPLGPVWVWLAFGETPERAAMIGGAIVFAAVAAHILAGLKRNAEAR